MVKRWFFSRRTTTSFGVNVNGGINNSASFIVDDLSSGICGTSEASPSVTVNIPPKSRVMTALYAR